MVAEFVLRWPRLIIGRFLVSTQISSKANDYLFLIITSQSRKQMIKNFKNSNIIMFDNNTVVLSYSSQKANNLSELQIVDLQETILQKQKKLGINEVKQLVSRVYNIYCETEDVYRQLRAPFLYQQNKKLFNCLGMIFLSLVDKVQKKNNAISSVIIPDTLTTQSSQISQRQSKIEPKIYRGLVKNRNKNTVESELTRQFKSTQGNEYFKPRRFGGVYIYNQDIKRNIQSLNSDGKQKSKKKKNLTQQDSKADKRKFMQEIMEIATGVDRDYLQPDQVAKYLSERRSVGQKLKHIQFSDQLQKIALFFKESQNDALQFLKNSKDHNTMLEFTESFHRIVVQYKSSKNIYVQAITKKVVEAVQMIKTKYEELAKFYKQKQEQILGLKNKHKKKCCTVQTQTTQDLVNQIKKLELKVSHLQEDYNILENYRNKQIQGEVKSLGNFGMDMRIKQQKIKKMEQAMVQKNAMIQNLQMKIKICNNNLKNIKRESFMMLDQNTRSDIISQIFDECRQNSTVSGERYPIFISKPRQIVNQNDDKSSEISSYTQQNTKFNKKRRGKNISHELKAIKKLSKINNQSSEKRQSILLNLPASLQIPKKRRMSKKINAEIIQQESERNMISDRSFASKRNIKTTEKKKSIFKHNYQQNAIRKHTSQDQEDINQKSSLMKKTAKGKIYSKPHKQKQIDRQQNATSNRSRKLSPQEKKLSLRETKSNQFSSIKSKKRQINHNKEKSKMHPTEAVLESKKQIKLEELPNFDQQNDEIRYLNTKNNKKEVGNQKKTQKLKKRRKTNQNFENKDEIQQNDTGFYEQEQEDLYNQNQQQNQEESIDSYESEQQQCQEDEYYQFAGQICPQFSISLNFKKERQFEIQKQNKQTNRNSIESVKSGKNLFSISKDKRVLKVKKQVKETVDNNSTGKHVLKTASQSLPKVFKKIDNEFNKKSSTAVLKRQSLAKKKSDSNFCLPNEQNQFAVNKVQKNKIMETMPDQYINYQCNQIARRQSINNELINASMDQDSILNIINFNKQKQQTQMNVRMQLQAIILAKKSKNVQQFAKKIRKIHKLNCGQNCIHLKRYIQNFARYQNQSQNQTRQTMKIHIQYLNQNLPDYQQISKQEAKNISTQKTLPYLSKNK